MKSNRGVSARMTWVWLGVVCVLVITWLLSLAYEFRWKLDTRDDVIEIGAGSLRLMRYDATEVESGAFVTCNSEPTLWWFDGAYDPDNYYMVAIPLWVLAVAAAVPAAFAWRASRRARAGYCSACGYDRTGLDPAKPCPECGGVMP